MSDEIEAIIDTDATIAALQEEAASEAKASYDLRDRLAGARKRKKSVTVYADDEAGKDLGGVEPTLGFGGVPTGKEKRWGLMGRIAELKDRADELMKIDDPDEDDQARIAAVAEEIERATAELPELLARVKASSFTFDMRTIPEIIQRDCKRKARDVLGITEKGVPADRMDDYNEEYATQFLVASVERWVDHGAGREFTSIDREQITAFRDLLPPGQFNRIELAAIDLSSKEHIAQQITDTPDF